MKKDFPLPIPVSADPASPDAGVDTAWAVKRMRARTKEMLENLTPAEREVLARRFQHVDLDERTRELLDKIDEKARNKLNNKNS